MATARLRAGGRVRVRAGVVGAGARARATVSVRAGAACPLDSRLILGRQVCRRELQLLGMHVHMMHVHARLLRNRSLVGAQPGRA